MPNIAGGQSSCGRRGNGCQELRFQHAVTCKTATRCSQIASYDRDIWKQFQMADFASKQHLSNMPLWKMAWMHVAAGLRQLWLLATLFPCHVRHRRTSLNTRLNGFKQLSGKSTNKNHQNPTVFATLFRKVCLSKYLLRSSPPDLPKNGKKSRCLRRSTGWVFVESAPNYSIGIDLQHSHC